MKTLTALGAIAIGIASPLTVTPIDVLTIEAIFLALIGAAFAAHLATHHGDAELSMQPAIARLSPCEARNSRS
ncbi:MAG TPA: hypothetical protein VH206_00915 [Xanthobacteraceae bacterium]|jgi:hypothetical protein|nr:hypothetical protein [Xanthobacteraceae bacterium]